jgi:hypothetical protein
MDASGMDAGRGESERAPSSYMGDGEPRIGHNPLKLGQYRRPFRAIITWFYSEVPGARPHG